MDPITPSTQPSAPDADLASQFAGLKQLFYAAVFAMIILGASVNLYLAKQMRLARAQLLEQRQVSARTMEEFQKTSEPVVRNFVVALQGFAATNKDFEPIFAKYRGALSKYATGPTSTTPVAPAPR